jgi:hypothetical protein
MKPLDSLPARQTGGSSANSSSLILMQFLKTRYAGQFVGEQLSRQKSPPGANQERAKGNLNNVSII